MDEDNNHIFGNVEVTYRASRPGMFYGDCSSDSSSFVDSDYDSPEPQESESSSDLIGAGHDEEESLNIVVNDDKLGVVKEESIEYVLCSYLVLFVVFVIPS